jgi:hypothetical protein
MGHTTSKVENYPTTLTGTNYGPNWAVNTQQKDIIFTQVPPGIVNKQWPSGCTASSQYNSQNSTVDFSLKCPTFDNYFTLDNCQELAGKTSEFISCSGSSNQEIVNSLTQKLHSTYPQSYQQTNTTNSNWIWALVIFFIFLVLIFIITYKE